MSPNEFISTWTANDLTERAGAKMYAAQLFNQRHHNPQKVIYGCVTNAFTWCFLKLEQNTLYSITIAIDIKQSLRKLNINQRSY